MSLLKKLAGETALYGLSSILGRLLTFVFLTPFLTYTFNEDRAQMGIQTDVYAWAAFLMILFTYRIETAFFRFGNQAEQRPRAFKTAGRALWITTFVWVSVMVLLADPIAGLLGYPDKGHYIVWFAFILGFDALSALPFAHLRLEGRALQFASIKLLNLLVHLGFVWGFLYLLPNYSPHLFDPEMGVGYVFLANLLASALTFVLLLPLYWQGKPLSEDALAPVFDRLLLRQMLWYALPLVLAGFAGIVNEVLDRILLKYLLPGSTDEVLQQLGVYGACYKIAIFMNLFTQAFNYAAEPFFFKNAGKSFAKPLYANVAFAFTLVGVLGFLGILLFMDIVQYFVASNYREGLIIVPVLLLANLCLGLYYNVAVWFKLSDQTKYGAWIALAGASLTIIGNLTLVPLMLHWGYPGYLGSAWATLLCYGSMLGLAYALGQRHYPIPYPMLRMLSYILLAVLVYLCYAFVLKPYVIAGSLVSFILSTAILLVFIAVIAVVDGRKIKEMLTST